MSDEFSVKVIRQAPVPNDGECDGSVESISQQLSTSSLWPANHKILDVGLAKQATSDCGDVVENPNLMTKAKRR